MVAIFIRTGLAMPGVRGLCSTVAEGVLLLMTYKGVETEVVDILLGDGDRVPRTLGERSSVGKGGVCLGGGEFINRLGEQIDLCLKIFLCCFSN